MRVTASALVSGELLLVSPVETRIRSTAFLAMILTQAEELLGHVRVLICPERKKLVCLET